MTGPGKPRCGVGHPGERQLRAEDVDTAVRPADWAAAPPNDRFEPSSTDAAARMNGSFGGSRCDCNVMSGRALDLIFRGVSIAGGGPLCDAGRVSSSRLLGGN